MNRIYQEEIENGIEYYSCVATLFEIKLVAVLVK